jgi:uncharacterized protein YlxW (UPF0749 family)
MPSPSTTRSRVDGSMSLLVDMTEAALDPAYADQAARKASGPGQPRPRWQRTPSSLLLLVVLVVVGLVSGVAGVQQRKSAHASGQVRRDLVTDVRQQTRDTDALATRAEGLRKQVADLRDRGLGEDAAGRRLAEQISALELASGQTPVSGPGLQVTLRDAQGADAGDGTGRGGQLGDGRIYDRDLQDLANALWAVGAEAISINGQRLTATTAIRSAGEAVLVDFRPLSPPYVVRAIGDVDAMEPAFADSPTARRFATYTSLYGLGFAVRREGRLTLPAAVAPDLRSARPGGAS